MGDKSFPSSHFSLIVVLHFQPVEANDEAFWSQFWSESVTCVQDIFTLIPAAEIRALREENPSNLATLCYKAVEKLVEAGDAGCRTHREQQTGNYNVISLNDYHMNCCVFNLEVYQICHNLIKSDLTLNDKTSPLP